MGKNYIKNFIVPFALIVSIISMPLTFLPKKAKATGISGYISGLSGVITQLPLCQGKITSLFSGGGKTDINGLTEKATDALGEELTGTLTKKASKAAAQSESIPVSLPDEVTKDIATTKAGVKKVQESTSSINTNDTCLKSIGRAVIKMLLQKITKSTVEWINGGMDGSPKFIENSGDFFGDIAKNEILQFGIEINDPELFPFGQAFMQNQAIAFQNHFADNAQYSLDKMIQDTNPESGFTAQTFQADFSKGGWGAWEALTQVPANNPFGFNLMASNELQRRLEGTSQSTAQEIRDNLKEAGGYLGTQKCRDPEGLSKSEHAAGLVERSKSPNGPYQHGICTGGWEYVTPGQMVATAATKTVSYPDNNLLKAEDLNDAVAAILDALLNSFSSSFMSENGFAGLQDDTNFQLTESSPGGFVIDEENTEQLGSVVGKNFSSLQIAGSSFLQQNPNFDVATDVNQALIDEQRIFVDKILNQNKLLISKIPLTPENNPTGKFTGNVGLIPVIHQLDYCIPGPHPDWDTDSRRVLKAALDTIVPETINSLEDRDTEEVLGMVKESLALIAGAVGAALGATVLSVVPVVGTLIGAVVGAVVGYIVGWIIDLFSGKDGEQLARMYYNAHLKLLTNTAALTCQEGEDCADGDDEAAKRTPALHNKGTFVRALNVVLDRYILAVNDVFAPEKMPSITEEARQKYMQLKGYTQMYKNNEERVTALKSVVIKLTDLRESINKLNKDLEDKTVKDINGNIAPTNDTLDADGNIIVLGQESQYQENLKILSDQFARISQDMVTGDDIAIVENTNKQIEDETRYIYNIMLKGPKGCEASNQYRRGREGQDGTGLPWPIYDAQRYNYGIPLLYDYNHFKNTSPALPDPLNSGYTNNKVPQALNLPPAMLPLVLFENNGKAGGGHWCGDNYSGGVQNPAPAGELHAPICLHDLFPLRNFSGWVNDRWEKAIGVY